MRLDQRHYDAESIKKFNQADWKEKEKEWVQCDKCKSWLWEEFYFKAQWRTGPAWYSLYRSISSDWSASSYRICAVCCPTKLAVVDYLTEQTEENKKSYDKSYKKHEKEEKKKAAKATCIMDGKTYSMTFEQTGE